MLLSWVRKKGKVLQVSDCNDDCLTGLFVECICISSGYIKIYLKLTVEVMIRLGLR